jgi:4'-phosphopantetheinyl transferase
MMDVWYLNAKNVVEEDVRVLLKFLPYEMVREVNRYANHEDRRVKLFGKLMVRKYFEDNHMEFKWLDWRVSFYGKPFYKEGKKFNISHSGDYVVVGFSDQEIGTDIEKVTTFDIASALDYLHPREAEFIKSASSQEEVFFKVWTRKEAYLKAIGKGIIDGLNNENCLQDELINGNKWHLYSLSVISKYQMALCTRIRNCQINIRELYPYEFQD